MCWRVRKLLSIRGYWEISDAFQHKVRALPHIVPYLIEMDALTLLLSHNLSAVRLKRDQSVCEMHRPRLPSWMSCPSHFPCYLVSLTRWRQIRIEGRENTPLADERVRGMKSQSEGRWWNRRDCQHSLSFFRDRACDSMRAQWSIPSLLIFLQSFLLPFHIYHSQQFIETATSLQKSQ